MNGRLRKDQRFLGSWLLMFFFGDWRESDGADITPINCKAPTGPTISSAETSSSLYIALAVMSRLHP